jgi:hypothetical protein
MCRDEADAKRIASGLYRKGYRVAAQTAYGLFPPRRVEYNQMKNWLSE